VGDVINIRQRFSVESRPPGVKGTKGRRSADENEGGGWDQSKIFGVKRVLVSGGVTDQ